MNLVKAFDKVFNENAFIINNNEDIRLRLGNGEVIFYDVSLEKRFIGYLPYDGYKIEKYVTAYYWNYKMDEKWCVSNDLYPTSELLKTKIMGSIDDTSRIEKSAINVKDIWNENDHTLIDEKN